MHLKTCNVGKVYVDSFGLKVYIPAGKCPVRVELGASLYRSVVNKLPSCRLVPVLGYLLEVKVCMDWVVLETRNKITGKTTQTTPKKDAATAICEK